MKQREQLIQRMYQDKKNSANRTPNFTLLRAVGEPEINQYVSEKDIDEALSEGGEAQEADLDG